MIKAAGSRPITYAYDAVALNNSTLTLARVLLKTSPSGKGKVISTEPLTQEEHEYWPKEIEYQRVGVWTAYDADAPCMCPLMHQSDLQHHTDMNICFWIFSCI